jgi:hypothetical protein
MYYHCGKCLKERPEDVAPRDWARINVGATKRGIQIWCTRHDVNIAHIELANCKKEKHVADLSAEGDFA